MSESTDEQSSNTSEVRLTAGQRLAAQKAAKAAMKARKRGKAVVEDEILKKASKAGEWIGRYRRGFAAVVAGIVVAIGAIGVGWWYQAGQAHKASALLLKAVETTTAPIGEASTFGVQAEAEKKKERFKTTDERARKAIKRYGKVIAQFPNTEAADWARLGQAGQYMLLADSSKAAKRYNEVADAARQPWLSRQALQGLIATSEQQKDYKAALEHANALAALNDGAFKDLAEYHTARILLAQGEKKNGAQRLKKLVERLRKDNAPTYAYLLGQAELTLLAADPSLLPGGRLSQQSQGGAGAGLGGLGGMGGLEGLENLSPEQLQMLLQQLQQQQPGSAPAPQQGQP